MPCSINNRTLVRPGGQGGLNSLQQEDDLYLSSYAVQYNEDNAIVYIL
jgi:hypothetical protein